MTRNTRVSLTAKLLALVTALFAMIAMAMPASTAMAVDTIPGGSDFTFTKELTFAKNANTPNVTFSYTVSTINSAVTIDGSVFYPNPGSSLPSVGTANFTSDDQPQSTSPDDGFNHVTKDVTVDFSGITFGPGIYRYFISENNGGQDGITYDITQLTLDVYVTYQENGSDLQITYLLHKGIGIAGDSGDNEKVKGFRSDSIVNYTTHNLMLSKTVTGNQGDHNKYFEFTVTISNAVPDTIYTVDTANGAGDTDHSNPTKLTVKDAPEGETTGSVSNTFYLKHGQSITIQGLTSATEYEITETDYSGEGYTTTNDVNKGENADGKTTKEQAMGNDDVTVTFTNTKNGSIPATGLLLEVAPYALLVVVIAGGLVALTLTSRKQRNR